MLLSGPRRALLAEAAGAALLVTAVVGSGIAASQLTADPGLRLLINAFATAGALVALITAFASVSAARFNPAVTLLALAQRRITLPAATAEIGAQLAGAVSGTLVANVMFGAPIFAVASTERTAGRFVFSEVVATAGLLLVIELTARRHGAAVVAGCVAGYIAGAYFFTSSTSFANPAVTVARTFTDTYTGISPAGMLRFIPAQLLGVAVASGFARMTADPA